jgi:hypothetical protein
MTPGHRVPDPSPADSLIGLDDQWIERMALLYQHGHWAMTFEEYLRIAVRFSAPALSRAKGAAE